MGLSVALNAARGSLQANAIQTDVVSRNVAGAYDPSYSRKISSLVTTDGPVRVVINRASSTALFDRMMGSTSELAGYQAVLDGLTSLEDTVGDTDAGRSIAAKVGALNIALGDAAGEPNDINLAKAAVAAARDLARSLNQASSKIQAARLCADQDIANSVTTINDLLRKFDTANRAVVVGTVRGEDISDALDNRDKILAQLSHEIGISTIVRENNDMAIYADNGSPLFERGARTVTFAPTPAFVPGRAGKAVFIDGVQVTGPGSVMPLQTGRIVGQMTVRDDLTVTYQKQLDAIAGGLIAALAETDSTSLSGTPLAGLLTYPGGPALPAAGTVGVAGTIRVNPAADPEQGGNPFTLRDGGMNAGAQYAYNTTNAAAFSEHLKALRAALGAERTFLPDSELPHAATLQVAAETSASWLEATRQGASKQVDRESALLDSASTALSNATGVNRDDEVATMLQLEKSYAASAKLIATVIQGFSQFVMSGDFVIGLVVFAILITVNFLVITKGATRIAEVGARFTLDAIPGKQMAIDADLSAGLVDDKEAQRRRRELEEESAFFGSMDGASKFVRGEAIASLIVIAVNIFGGIIIGVTRHGLPLAKAADVFTKLSVGDGLVSQIPALIVSLAAGLLVSKGGTRGTAEQAVLGQLGAYPRALFVAAGLMLVFAILPGMPFVPFAVLSVLMGTIAYLIPRRLAEVQSKADAEARAKERQLLLERQDSEAVKESLKTAEIELRLGKHLAVQMQPAQQELAHRVGRMRRKFAQQYGFVVPEIRLVESATVPSKSYEIAIHGTVIAAQQVRPGEMMIVVGDGPLPTVTGEEVREPAFGMRAVWVPDAYAPEARREGFSPIDWHAVMLTHVSEVIRNNLPQLLSYKDMRMLIDRLDAEYKRLVDEICPSQISYSGLQAVLKLLLAERVSIRNLHLIIEAVAEIVPHARRAEQIAEHVRLRIAQQICGDLAENGVLHVLRLGSRWDLTFHQGLKRDAKGDVVEVDIDPRLIEQFGVEASEAIRTHMKTAHRFALVTAPEVRSYVRMIIERLFPTVAVLSHVEIARGVEIKSLGTIS